LLNAQARMLFTSSVFAVAFMFVPHKALALELSAGKYMHTFGDGTCGAYTVNSKSQFTKYEYGPCGKNPSYVTRTVRIIRTTLKSGAVTISEIETDTRCFWGVWQWQHYTIPNKRFCRR
jgi:hypothetical protein